MKRLLTMLTLLTAGLALGATPRFDSAKRYHIVCKQWTSGCVTDGKSAGQQTPVYYLTQASASEETYWVFTEERQGAFSIRNAKTQQYITYDGVRDDNRRYVSLTDALDGDKSLWDIYHPFDGDDVYAIRNVGQNDHVWDVRTGSYMVGTYSRPGMQDISAIESFYFYDEAGQKVGDRASNETDDGYDVSSWLVATTDALDTWKAEGGWFLNTGAGGSHFNENEWAYLVAPFIENWHESAYGPLEDCELSQTLTHLPAGSYTLHADMMCVRQSYNDWWSGSGFHDNEPGTGVQLYAGEAATEVSTGNDPPQHFTVDFTVSATGDVTIGVRAQDTNANWIAIDNVQVIYHATEDEMLQGEKAKVRYDLGNYYSDSEIDALLLQAGDDFDDLEELRKSTGSMAGTDPLARALRNLTIDGRALAYVESLDLYLCTLPLEHFNDEYRARIDYEQRPGSSELKIGTTTVTPGSQYRFATVRAGRTYSFTVTTGDGTVVKKDITFTSLPVVKIYGSFNNEYSRGSIIVHEADKDAPLLLAMKAKWRGGITNGSGKHKRNYHVKLLNEDGEKMEQKFFGLRKDNSWILESCQVDMSRIRNRMLTDLWNDYATPPYYINEEPKALSGSRGRFVELIVNDEYRGIYCMTENMDRKQMKLKKYDEDAQQVHGQLFKSKDWSYAVFMGHDTDRNTYPKRHPNNYYEWSESWDQYYVKYPDHEDYGYNTDWKTLYDAVDFVCTSTDANFKEHFSEYFDLPVVIDYYILMETILSTDNHGKNMFFAIYDKQQDKRVTLGVWDMDATCGQRWSDDYYHQSFLGPEQDYAQFITQYEHGDYNLFRRLKQTNAEDFNMQVRLRYRDLRDSFLATESILDRFRTQLEEFKTCGAAQREYDRWSYDTDVARRELNFDVELAYLEDWFTRRMNYLDTKRFKISELPPTGVDALTAAPQTADSDVYDMSGRKVGTAQTLQSLPAGVYVVGGRKVVVKKQ